MSHAAGDEMVREPDHRRHRLATALGPYSDGSRILCLCLGDSAVEDVVAVAVVNRRID